MRPKPCVDERGRSLRSSKIAPRKHRDFGARTPGSVVFWRIELPPWGYHGDDMIFGNDGIY